MSKQITAGHLVQGQHIIFNGKIERVRRVRLVAHDTVLLAVGSCEVRRHVTHKYSLIE